jgi:hypothetical protein
MQEVSNLIAVSPYYLYYRDQHDQSSHNYKINFIYCGRRRHCAGAANCPIAGQAWN